MRKLATVDTIRSINPIEGADAIEVATVRGWQVVVKKNEFQIGDLCIYCEVDSNLPLDNPHFAFLQSRANGRDRFRVRTIKLRGQISQGIVFPVSILPSPVNVGGDVTEMLNIEKYEPPVSAQLSGQIKGVFPSFIPKTDEERIQNLVDMIENFRGQDFYITEKLDGTSATFFFNGEFGACSRNFELRETEDNTHWMVARKLNIEDVLRREGNFAIQGEIVGPGIQKNRLNLKDHELRVFRVFNIDEQRALDFKDTVDFCNRNGLTMVPVKDVRPVDGMKISDFIDYSTAKSSINPSAMVEGFVFRTTTHNPYFSFKVINPQYLLKHGE